MEKAQNIFEDKVKNYSKMVGVKVKHVSIKNLRNRWGSLTKRSTININLNLIKAPEDVIDYIVLHELCHLKVEGHSHHYWDLLRFTVFISLAKTIGDNLVWILKLYLSLNIKHINRDLTSNKFKEVLKDRFRFFYNLLYSNNYFSEYEKLCELRDQHRHIIRAMRVVTISGENKILIPKDPEYLISQDLRIINNPQPDTS
jgi:hypothetical protein